MLDTVKSEHRAATRWKSPRKAMLGTSVGRDRLPPGQVCRCSAEHSPVEHYPPHPVAVAISRVPVRNRFDGDRFPGFPRCCGHGR